MKRPPYATLFALALPCLLLSTAAPPSPAQQPTTAPAAPAPPAATTPARDPTTQHAVVDATDKAALAAHLGQFVVVVGEVSSAEWSSTGKVMNIDFKGAEESRLLAVVFERNRARLDEMFNGDLAKSLRGAKVRLNGRLEEYGGRVESFKGRPQLILDRSSQITIVEPAKP